MRRPISLAIVISLLIVGQVIGQHQSAAIGAKIQKSSVASERAKLGFLAGTFTTETVIPSSKPSPNGATGKGTSTIAWGLDSMFLLINDETPRNRGRALSSGT